MSYAKPKIRNLVETFALVLSVFAAALIAVNGKYANAVICGVELWAANVFPALFPYLFLTFIVSSLKITGKLAERISPFTEKLFNVNGNAGFALIISLISGYPLGAKTVSDLRLKGALNEEESVRAACLCSSSSPVFLIGSVGNLTFNNPFFGLMLFITHVLSVLTVGFIFSFYKRTARPKRTVVSTVGGSGNLLYDGVTNAVFSVLAVGGIITLFYLLTEMLSDIKILEIISSAARLVLREESAANGVAAGLFECTKGLKILAGGGVSLLTLPVAAAICGFGGLSVIAQSAAYLKKAEIKTAPFFLSKTLAAIVNFILGLIFSLLFFA